MSRLSSCCAVMLLALPLGAAADPLTVISETRGTVDPRTHTFALLDMYPADDAESVPFSLRLEASFDPDSPDFYPDLFGLPTIFRTPVSVEFTVGDRSLSFTGNARLGIGFDSAGNFNQAIDFEPLYHLSIRNVFTGAALADGDHFGLRQLGNADGLSGGFGLEMWPSNPDAPGYWTAGAQATYLSLQVISAVPEPGQWTMLAAGLLLGGAGARRLRRA